MKMKCLLIMCVLLAAADDKFEYDLTKIKPLVLPESRLAMRVFFMPSEAVDLEKGFREVDWKETSFDWMDRHYRLGQRKTGDRLLAGSGDIQTCANYPVCMIVFAYPLSGKGSLITSMDCSVRLHVSIEDESRSIRPYVKRGGIGQNFIEVAIELHKTAVKQLIFGFGCYVYGY